MYLDRPLPKDNNLSAISITVPTHRAQTIRRPTRVNQSNDGGCHVWGSQRMYPRVGTLVRQRHLTQKKEYVCSTTYHM